MPKRGKHLGRVHLPPNLECCLGFLHFHVGILEGKGVSVREPKVKVVMVEEIQVLNKSIR